MIDAHAHLQAQAFAGDLPEVLERAASAGLSDIIVPGWDVASSQAAVALCSSQTRGDGPRLAAAAGIHPHAAAAAGAEAWEAIEALATEEHVVAIGETGLDYDRMFSPRPAQLANLRRHVDLARRTGKPLVLHCRSAAGRRDAQDELLLTLEERGLGGLEWQAVFHGRAPGVLHSYSGPQGYAERALALGLAVSFSGLVFRPGEDASVDVARLVPADRMLVETDSPFLAPRDAPRRRNEPSFVGITARWLAGLRKSEVAPLERDLAETFRSVFRMTQADATSGDAA